MVADALAAHAGLKPQNSSRRVLDISGCAKVNCRIGEASNPGPRRGVADVVGVRNLAFRYFLSGCGGRDVSLP